MDGKNDCDLIFESSNDEHNWLKINEGDDVAFLVLCKDGYSAGTYEYEVIRFSVAWDRYGDSAGYRCNAEMAKYASEAYGVLIAFWDGQSRGTKHMIDLAKRYGLEVHVVNYKENN